MNTSSAQVPSVQTQKMRMQYLQDIGFEKLTMVFAATTLVALLGIIISLLISAWPALKEFGIPFSIRLSGTSSTHNLVDSSPFLGPWLPQPSRF